MEIYKYILVASAGYLLGSLSMSIILSRAVFKAGALTLGGDVLKASLSMLIGWLLLGDVGLALGGIASLVGHCFPVYYNFRGGKGVSVGAAVALAIDWRVFLSIVLVFALAAFLSKKVSLGSVCAAVAISITSLIFQVSTPKLILAVFGMLLVVFQHRENIKRLINGTEPDFKPAKPPVKDNIET